MFPKEKQFANILNKQNRKWKYPAKRFKLKNTTYRPDFFLPDENLYIEVVGTRQAYHQNKHKIAELKKLIIVDFEGHELKILVSKLKRLHCLRCGYKSTPRRPEIRQCPRCKSAYWDKPKKGA